MPGCFTAVTVGFAKQMQRLKDTWIGSRGANDCRTIKENGDGKSWERYKDGRHIAQGEGIKVLQWVFLSIETLRMYV